LEVNLFFFLEKRQLIMLLLRINYLGGGRDQVELQIRVDNEINLLSGGREFAPNNKITLRNCQHQKN